MSQRTILYCKSTCPCLRIFKKQRIVPYKKSQNTIKICFLSESFFCSSSPDRQCFGAFSNRLYDRYASNNRHKYILFSILPMISFIITVLYKLSIKYFYIYCLALRYPASIASSSVWKIIRFFESFMLS